MERIRFFVRKAPGRPLELKNGRVDFFELQTIQNVRAGQVLAEALPEVEDFDPREFPLGQNVYIPPENPRVLLSAVDGHAYWKDGKIHVSPLYVVDDDVGASTGNLHFVGKIWVKGTVRAGFLVEAKEAIIEGDVEGTVLTKRDLEVKGGIANGRKRVICGGNLRATYILNSHVEARGDIEVESYIRDSEVYSGGTITVHGRPGAIIGGHVQAKRGIKIRVLGSGLSTGTRLSAGIDPFLERLVRVKLKELEEERAQIEEIMRDPELPFEELFDLDRQLKEIEFYRSLMEESLYEGSQEAFIEVQERAYQGATISIGRESLRLEEDLEGVVRFLLKGDKITL